jgi:hypothetical protein
MNNEHKVGYPLSSLQCAAAIVGRRVTIELVSGSDTLVWQRVIIL